MTRCDRVRPFRLSATFAAGLLACVALSASPLAAQPSIPTVPAFDQAPLDPIGDWSDEVPAHIAAVDGAAWLQRDGTNEAAAENTPLLAGDRIHTADGRLEVVFADGSILAFDEQTDATLLSDDLLRLDRGRVRLELARSAGDGDYRIDAVGTISWVRSPGEYRVQIDNRGDTTPHVQLLVIRGAAELDAAGQRTLVRAGYAAAATAETAPSLPYAVTVSSWDGFDRWWDERRYERTGLASTRYLPAEISYYGGVLDRNGDWGYESTVGTYVWYPRVDPAWQPYSTGRWSFVGSYGWVWIGADRWAWPTHHYGRWGVSGRRYYWIPGRRWAPAWVSWTSTPDYVGWCPIGFDNRPLISVSIGFSQGWRGWTYLPSRSFNLRVVVAGRGRDRYLPPRNTRFIDGYRGPSRPAGLVVRNSPGLRGPAAAGRSVAVPRWAPRDAPAGGVSTDPFARRTTTPARTSGARAVSREPEARPPATRTVAPTGTVAPSRARTSRSSSPGVSMPTPTQRTTPGRSTAIGARPRLGAASPSTPGAEAPRTSPRSTVQQPTMRRGPGTEGGAALGARSRTGRAPATASEVAPPSGVRTPTRSGVQPAQRTESTQRPLRTMPASRPSPPPAGRNWSTSRESGDGAAAAPAARPRSAPSPGRVPSATPSRAPRVETPRPSERPAPAARSAPAQSGARDGGGRAAPRGARGR